MTADELIAFEREIADLFNAGRIRAPVHLAGGNEEQLIQIFKGINPDDYVFCQWRSHYHCLLKGVPPEELKAEILAGRSIALCFPKYRILSSAIAGGHLPIALGVALNIKRNRGNNHVWAFMGDMTAEMGIARECTRYAYGHDLPISFISECNGKSVCTDTRAAWGESSMDEGKSWVYEYQLPWPHSGAGVRVNF